jgi:hypothetical protein
MKNQYRIKLEIKLKDYPHGMKDGDCKLVIKVLKKDNRFDVRPNSDGTYSSLIFTAPDGFQVTTTSHTPKGYLGEDFFAIPSKKYMNRKITKGFYSDTLRKIYLKQLYTSLMAWSEQWQPFGQEPTAKIKTMGNKWYIYITK